MTSSLPVGHIYRFEGIERWTICDSKSTLDRRLRGHGGYEERAHKQYDDSTEQKMLNSLAMTWLLEKQSACGNTA
jgi:hypothetical protein